MTAAAAADTARSRHVRQLLAELVTDMETLALQRYTDALLIRAGHAP